MAPAPPRQRCAWCGDDPLYVAYHDDEWGVPEYDGRALFEKLLLDGFQAGLSWLTILRRRATLRVAFAGFVPARLARMDAADEARLLADPGIIRNRQKIRAAITNARAYEQLAAAGTDFAAALWDFVDGAPRRPRYATAADVPTQTAASVAMARWLRQRGFSFCGPVICHAFMQATGMTQDHVAGCFRCAD